MPACQKAQHVSVARKHTRYLTMDGALCVCFSPELILATLLVSFRSPNMLCKWTVAGQHVQISLFHNNGTALAFLFLPHLDVTWVQSCPIVLFQKSLWVQYWWSNSSAHPFAWLKIQVSLQSITFTIGTAAASLQQNCTFLCFFSKYIPTLP